MAFGKSDEFRRHFWFESEFLTGKRKNAMKQTVWKELLDELKKEMC